MTEQNRSGKLKGFFYYLPRTVNFFSLKNEKLTRTVFVIILFTSFLSSLIPAESSSGIGAYNLLVNIVSIAITYLASTVYLVAFIRELKNKEYTAKECYRRVMRKSFRVVVASVIYGVGFVIGVFAFVIPGMLFAVVYAFYICYIVDLGEGVGTSYQASKRITRGYRWQILNIVMAFYLILIIPVMLLVSFAASSGSSLIFWFVISFTGAVINLMYQRLIALLYMDLEYGNEDVNGNR